MRTVASPDGTRIAYWRSGAGPPLVLVHGAMADHTTTWRYVLPELERHFTVYAMDRRGRGASGDSADYKLQLEVEDVAALVDAIDEPVNLLGHSFGGMLALEAALLTSNLRRLILYEGVFLRGEDHAPPGLTHRLETLLEAGDMEGVLITVLREAAGMPPAEIEVLRSDPDAWAVRLRNAPTIPREVRAGERYTLVAERFRKMRTPTFLLVGEDSPPRELQNADAAAEILPEARVVILPGQQHLAMYTAPDLFVNEVVQACNDEP